MASWKWLLMAAASATLSAVSVSASSSDAQIFSMDTVPDWAEASAMALQVTAPDIFSLPFTVVPLTVVLGANQSQQTREVSLTRSMTEEVVSRLDLSPPDKP